MINVLSSLMIVHGKPGFIRSDNGPEFIAYALHDWLKLLGSDVAYIPPLSFSGADSFTFKASDGLLEIYRARTRYSIGKAKSELAYLPQVPLDKGMQLTAEWARWARLVK